MFMHVQCTLLKLAPTSIISSCLVIFSAPILVFHLLVSLPVHQVEGNRKVAPRNKMLNVQQEMAGLHLAGMILLHRHRHRHRHWHRHGHLHRHWHRHGHHPATGNNYARLNCHTYTHSLAGGCWKNASKNNRQGRIGLAIGPEIKIIGVKIN